MVEPYCLDLLRAQAPDVYLAALYAPRKHRTLFIAKAAWASELEHVCVAAKDPLLRAVRYAWWRERLEAGETRGHPLLATLQNLSIAPDDLSPLLDAWEAWSVGEGAQDEIGSAMAGLLGRTLWRQAPAPWLAALAALYAARQATPEEMPDLRPIRAGLAGTPRLARCVLASGPYVAQRTRTQYADALSLKLQIRIFRAVTTGRW